MDIANKWSCTYVECDEQAYSMMAWVTLKIDGCIKTVEHVVS